MKQSTYPDSIWFGTKKSSTGKWYCWSPEEEVSRGWNSYGDFLEKFTFGRWAFGYPKEYPGIKIS